MPWLLKAFFLYKQALSGEALSGEGEERKSQLFLRLLLMIDDR